MKKIVVISSSVRDGRLSHRAALFFESYLRDNGLAESEVLDLKKYDFPVFHERLAKQKEPSAAALDFTERFKAADGVLIVTPVYNGSFPASIKNVIDLYVAEWRHKPVAIASVTYGPVPGIATVQQLQTILLKMGALVVPALATVINTASELTEEGVPVNLDKFIPMMQPAVNELLWMMEKKSL